MTVFIRFFRRQGLSGAAAVTAGAIDSFTGNVLQALLVVGLAVLSSADVALELTALSGGPRTLLWVVIGLCAATALVAVARRPYPTLPRRPRAHLVAAGEIRTRRLANVAQARPPDRREPLGVAELVLINSGTSLLSSFVPVPGGIGVVEFSLEVGLTSAGMTASAAAATILLYRLATFYLPQLSGFVSFRWLQRNGYL